MQLFQPDIAVICDAQATNLRSLLPATTIINICHGVGVDHGFVARGTAEADFICVTGAAEGERLRDLASLPEERVWVTGYVAADPLFAGAPPPLPVALPAAGKTVLYAPHYRPDWSSVPLLGAEMAGLITGGRDDLSVITRPHPNIIEGEPRWLAWFREAARHDERFHLVEDMDVTLAPFMLAADLLVSDVSSSAFQYLALDRPIVLIDNPARRPDGDDDDPEAIRNAWRGLDDPGLFAAARGHRRRELFGDLTDGRAAERIAECIAAL